MSRQKELAKNTIVLTVGKICTQLVSFLLLPLYTAILTPDDYGVFDLFTTYIMLLVPIFNWQFDMGLFRYLIDVRNNKDEQVKLCSTVFVTNCVQIVVYVLFFVVAQNFISSEHKWYLLVDVIATIILNTLFQFARGVGHNNTYSLASFLSAGLGVALNVVLIAVLRWGAFGMFAANILAKIGAIIYLMYVERVWEYFEYSKADKEIFKKICKYAFPLIPNQFSWWVIGSSDRLIVSELISVAANGIYSVANKFSSIFITFYNIFNLAWTESTALHINDEDRDEFLESTINSMFRLFSAICLGIIACMPIAFPILINPQYNEAYPQVPILMIAVLFQVVVGLYSVIYVALKKSGEIAKTSFYAAVINVVVNILLIKHIGLYAASVSTLAAYGTMAIYRYFHVKKYVDVKLDKKIILSTIIVGIVELISYYYNDMIINWITLIGVAGYAAVLNKDFLMSTLKEIKDKANAILKKKSNNTINVSSEPSIQEELCSNKVNCCGCSACYSVCPVKAICMEEDEEGFLYPKVNQSKCIKCKKCLSVCAFKEDQKGKGYYE